MFGTMLFLVPVGLWHVFKIRPTASRFAFVNCPRANFKFGNGMDFPVCGSDGRWFADVLRVEQCPADYPDYSQSGISWRDTSSANPILRYREIDCGPKREC